MDSGVLVGGGANNGFVSVKRHSVYAGIQTSTHQWTGRPSGRPRRTLRLPRISRTLQRGSFPFPPSFRKRRALHQELAGAPLLDPAASTSDMSLLRTSSFNESVKLTFRTRASICSNHPQLGQPKPSIGNTPAGLISGTVGNPGNCNWHSGCVLKVSPMNSGCFGVDASAGARNARKAHRAYLFVENTACPDVHVGPAKCF